MTAVRYGIDLKTVGTKESKAVVEQDGPVCVSASRA
jgi:hypothetical protein